MNKKILLIEDDLRLRENITEVLTHEKYEVITAENGIDGLMKAYSALPDLILSDILMPEMNGFELLEKTRQNPILRDIPFIFISAKADTKDIRMGMIYGADDYLTKPFQISDMLESINTRLEKSERIRKKLNELSKNIKTSLPDEFRSPIQAILGYSELIIENNGLSIRDFEDFARYIHSSGRKLLNISENFLFHTNLELLMMQQGKLGELRNSPLKNANEIIELVAKNVAKKNGRENDLNIDLKPFTLNADFEHIQKIAQELMSNAVKYSKPGNKIHIKNSKEKGKIEITFTNEYSGLAPNKISLMHSEFRTENPPIGYEGIGLGLSIVKKITEIYEGELNAEFGTDSVTVSVSLKTEK